MTKRSADELHRTVAEARLLIKKLDKEIEVEESRAQQAEYESGKKFVELRMTDPETLNRYSFHVTQSKLQEIITQAPNLGNAAFVTDIADDAIDAIDESIRLARTPGYQRAVDEKVTAIRALWCKYVGEKMYEVVFPGGRVFYFADVEIARRFMREYQAMADKEWIKVGGVARTVPAEAFKVTRRKIEKTGLVTSYSDLYVPGLESEIRADMQKDAEHYVAGLK